VEGDEIARSQVSHRQGCSPIPMGRNAACTVPYPGVDKVKVKVNVGVKVNIRRRLGEETTSTSIADAGRRREEASPR